MTEAGQDVVGYALIVGMFLLFAVPTDMSFMVPVVGRKNYWRKRGIPVVLGWWLPSVAVAIGAIWLYASVPASEAWHWLAVGAGVAAWLVFFWLRQAIVRWHRARHGHPDPAQRKLTPREFWQGIRGAPRGRLIVLAVVMIWAVAGIVGGLLTFVIKR